MSENEESESAFLSIPRFRDFNAWWCTFVRLSSNGPQCPIARLINPGPHYLESVRYFRESPFPVEPNAYKCFNSAKVQVWSSCGKYLLDHGGVAKISPTERYSQERKKGNPRREDLAWLPWWGSTRSGGRFSFIL